MRRTKRMSKNETSAGCNVHITRSRARYPLHDNRSQALLSYYATRFTSLEALRTEGVTEE
jgi:hypothetical protein